ncbi:DUF6660 family protein [Chitinophaga sp. NPDC101104]|uniref:DUF6660 family protein n=1 Tax=Chitinophaga sp. NPDC101104 TaxID=3390561 RepID=UPI003D055B5F
MRIIALILSIVILAFSTTTCSDELAGHVTESSGYQLADAGTEHHEHMDFCSPLCACGCCAASVILPMGYLIPVQSDHSAFHYSEMPAGIITDVSPAVWQPPQV